MNFNIKKHKIGAKTKNVKMTTQLILATNLGNQFFNALSPDIVREIFKFITGDTKDISQSSQNDDRSIIATKMVCKAWQENHALENERAEAATRILQRMLGCPSAMIQVFQKSRTPIYRLPVLDLGNQIGRTDYIDFIQPANMPHSVMRFRDQSSRPGIALKIRASRRIALQTQLNQLRDFALFVVKNELRRGNLFSLIQLALSTALTVKKFFTQDDHIVVLALFKRFPPNHTETFWTYGWGNNDDTIENLYTARHDNSDHIGNRIERCPKCPFVRPIVNDTVLSTLLTGKDPDFSLSGPIPTCLNNQPVENRRSLFNRPLFITAAATVAVTVTAYALRAAISALKPPLCLHS